MGPSQTDITIERLEDQIRWYGRAGSRSKTAFQSLKICTVIGAALVPALSGIDKRITAGLGVFIVIMEGLQQLYQFQTNWITYRSTAEALKHEKYLYFGKAGVYATASDPHLLLAERIESLVSQEHANWSSIRQQNGPAENGK